MSLVSATTSISRSHSALWPMLLCSLALHVPLLWAIRAVSHDDTFSQVKPATSSANMRVRMLNQRPRDDKKTAQTKPPKKDKPKDLPKPLPPPPPEEQLTYVKLDRPLIEQNPDQARFMDRYAAKVEREMIKRGTEGKPVTTPDAKPLPPIPGPINPAARDAQPPQRNNPAEDRPQSDPEPSKRPPRPPDKELPTVPHESEIILPKPSSDTTGDKAQASAEGLDRPVDGPVDPKAMFPANNPGPIADKLGSDGMFDPTKQLQEGDRNLLNRRETRYWAFFDRVKRQIEREWSPQTEYRRRDPYGNVYGVKDRWTTAEVVLNTNGSIRKLQIIKSSGLDFYDDEAIRALNAAAPFANPPEGMMDEQGLVRFTFGFYFEINSGRSGFFRVKR
jgi:TonB family protein